MLSAPKHVVVLVIYEEGSPEIYYRNPVKTMVLVIEEEDNN